MNKQSIKDTVLRILATIAPDADLTSLQPKVSFHDQLDIDSIDFLRLMMELEKALKVTILDFDYPKLSTLQGCVDYLAEQLTATEECALS
ncbi:MAG: phosphopantetheine-binding protein [Candidatus Competibacteraceae bacterium]